MSDNCEYCNTALVSNSNGNMITVAESRMPSDGGMIYDTCPAAEIGSSPLAFCSLFCLKEWAVHAEPHWKKDK